MSQQFDDLEAVSYIDLTINSNIRSKYFEAEIKIKNHIVESHNKTELDEIWFAEFKELILEARTWKSIADDENIVIRQSIPLYVKDFA